MGGRKFRISHSSGCLSGHGNMRWTFFRFSVFDRGHHLSHPEGYSHQELFQLEWTLGSNWSYLQPPPRDPYACSNFPSGLRNLVWHLQKLEFSARGIFRGLPLIMEILWRLWSCREICPRTSFWSRACTKFWRWEGTGSFHRISQCIMFFLLLHSLTRIYIYSLSHLAWPSHWPRYVFLSLALHLAWAPIASSRILLNAWGGWTDTLGRLSHGSHCRTNSWFLCALRTPSDYFPVLPSVKQRSLLGSPLFSCWVARLCSWGILENDHSKPI